MALQKIYVDYDFNKNSILNAKLQPVTTAERNALASGYNSNDAGIIVYDTTLKLVYSWDGNQWDQVSLSDSQLAQIAEAFNKAQREWYRRQVHGLNQKKEGSEQSIASIDDLQKFITSRLTN